MLCSGNRQVVPSTPVRSVCAKSMDPSVTAGQDVFQRKDTEVFDSVPIEGALVICPVRTRGVFGIHPNNRSVLRKRSGLRFAGCKIAAADLFRRPCRTLLQVS